MEVPPPEAGPPFSPLDADPPPCPTVDVPVSPRVVESSPLQPEAALNATRKPPSATKD
jgi:hypothetical protein